MVFHCDSYIAFLCFLVVLLWSLVVMTSRARRSISARESIIVLGYVHDAEVYEARNEKQDAKCPPVMSFS
jgi:hypothetical protein